MLSNKNEKVEDSKIYGRQIPLSDDAINLAVSSLPDVKCPQFKLTPEVKAIWYQLSGRYGDDKLENNSSNDDGDSLKKALDVAPMMSAFKYILEVMDKLQQQMDWLVPTVEDMNKQTRKTNGKLIRLKEWHDKNEVVIEESLHLVKKHQEVLEKSSFLRDIATKILIAVAGAAGGILTWVELFEHFSK